MSEIVQQFESAMLAENTEQADAQLLQASTILRVLAEYSTTTADLLDSIRVDGPSDESSAQLADLVGALLGVFGAWQDLGEDVRASEQMSGGNDNAE